MPGMPLQSLTRLVEMTCPVLHMISIYFMDFVWESVILRLCGAKDELLTCPARQPQGEHQHACALAEHAARLVEISPLARTLMRSSYRTVSSSLCSPRLMSSALSACAHTTAQMQITNAPASSLFYMLYCQTLLSAAAGPIV